MTTTATHQTQIEADPHLPTVRIIRNFDAPPARVYRAWTDPELVVQWLGPRSITTQIGTWDARTGGSYRYSAWRNGEETAWSRVTRSSTSSSPRDDPVRLVPALRRRAGSRTVVGHLVG